MKSKKTFAVEVTQIRKIGVVIVAESEKEALKKVKEKYRNGEYELGCDTVVAAEFEIRNE